jgi:hypothetical protein
MFINVICKNVLRHNGAAVHYENKLPGDVSTIVLNINTYKEEKGLQTISITLNYFDQWSPDWYRL